MKHLLLPDYDFDTYLGFTPAFLKGLGIDYLLCDIDNTLVPYEIAEPTDEVRAWLTALNEAGIKTAFVSNNHAPRVELFNKTLGYPAFPDSGKPFKKACRAAMEAMGSKPENTAIIGDQVFTDVLAGRNAGLNCALLVKPIKDKTNLFFRTKRLMEVPILKKYKKLHPETEKGN